MLVEDQVVTPETKPKEITDIQLCTKYIRLAKSAEDRGIEFGLSLATFRNLLKRKKCPYTGVDLINNGTNNNVSIDRIDNSKGYIDSNVIACEITANQIKNNMPVEMILNIAKVVIDNQKKNRKSTIKA